MIALLRAVSSFIRLILLAARRPRLEVRHRERPRQEPDIPSVPHEARKLLDDVQPPTPDELELYVPQEYRELGPDWMFTRGKVLIARELRRESIGETDGYFDGPSEWIVYDGAYGYYDDRGRLQIHAMEPTNNDRLVRPGRPFIILFDRRSPRTHHLFTLVRQPVPKAR